MIINGTRAQDKDKKVVIIQSEPPGAMVYKVYVYDTGGLSAANNEEKGKTNANEHPMLVTLNPPTPVANSSTSLNISWSKNQDQDFASYKYFGRNLPGLAQLLYSNYYFRSKYNDS
jgi:hypothetical protein